MSSTRNSFELHAFCALPLVRRAYQALVVGVAVFVAMLVMLREPFRGYLAEVQITGPATEGLDLDGAVAWLKETDQEVAAVARPTGAISAKCQIRATFVAARPAAATMHLDQLAERWMYQYLPDRLQAHRRTAVADLRSGVQALRDREDAAHQHLEGLRQQQLALLVNSSTGAAAVPIAAQPATVQPAAVQPVANAATTESAAAVTTTQEGRGKLLERLEILKLELSRLLGSLTEEHPQVVTMRMQIAAIEKQLEREGTGDRGRGTGGGPDAANGPELGGTRPAERHVIAEPIREPGMVSHFVSTGTREAVGGEAADGEVATIAAEMTAAIDELSRASRERQRAEQRLSERMQEIGSQPTAAQWSAARARVVVRLGGTPRSSTLALAGLLSMVAGVVMFRAAAFSCGDKIATTGELASALELPVIGNLAALRASTGRIRRRLFTPGRVKVVLIVAEVIVGVAVVACLVAMAMEPALARQVVADPFGTLSEVIGRSTKY